MCSHGNRTVEYSGIKILHALNKLKRRFDASAFRKKPKQKETSVYLKYGIDLALRLGVPDKLDDSTAKVIGPIKDVDISDVNDLVRRIDKLEGMGEPVVVYPDAEEFIQHQLHRQRIKNWEAQTTRVVKSLKSRFALVLSGTPLENRLDELYSVVQFVDGRHLGPGFRFFNKYRITDDKGYVLGYQKLDELREQLRPILLRRTRDMVMKELPPRNMEIVRIPPTDKQRALHGAHMQIVASITRKAFISEMDLLRLRQALMMCRMAADSTKLVDKQGPGFSTKLDTPDELFEQLFVEGDHKAVLFSEWTGMLNLIEPLLKNRKVPFVRLEGKIPQSKRQQIVNEFQTNPKCKVFLSTNAGSTGLNLQAADTVINVDLPWNPAVLEQRIARAHRMGQKRPVNVYVLVTEQTLEEELLKTISQKKELAMAALDYDSDISEVNLQSGMDELKSRLEVLLGALPEGHLDASLKREKEAEAAQLVQRREKMADAGGQLLTAGFGFLSQMLPDTGAAPATETVTALREQLSAAAETDEKGQKSLKINLPSEEALYQFAEALAKLMAFRQ